MVRTPLMIPQALADDRVSVATAGELHEAVEALRDQARHTARRTRHLHRRRRAGRAGRSQRSADRHCGWCTCRV